MEEWIRWGMIGCGNVTEVKNGPGLYLAEHSVFKGVWNRTASKAQEWTARHGHGRVYDSAEALLRDPDIDIVYIATTPDTHCRYALLAAEHGKHALVEKPVAPTLQEGLRMQEAFRKAGKKCFVCFYRRAMGRFVRMRELVLSGEIGELSALNMLHRMPPPDQNGWRADPAVCGGDLFTETDIHELDIMQFLLGTPSETHFTRDARHSNYSLSFRFPGGAVASGLFGVGEGGTCDRFTLIGTRGFIDCAFWNSAAPLFISGINGVREETIPPEEHVGLPMEQLIVNDLLGKGSFGGTLDAAIETLRITSLVYGNEKEEP